MSVVFEKRATQTNDTDGAQLDKSGDNAVDDSGELDESIKEGKGEVDKSVVDSEGGYSDKGLHLQGIVKATDDVKSDVDVVVEKSIERSCESGENDQLDQESVAKVDSLFLKMPDQLFEIGRESAMSGRDFEETLVIENENFRNSKLVIDN